MDAIQLLAEPILEAPVLLAGFGGWPNAGEVATSTIDYLVEHLGARELAILASDKFYLFSLNRPLVTITNGRLQSIDLPRSRFHFWTNPQGSDLILFRGPEPQVNWNDYVEVFLQLCRRFQVKAFYTLGGLHDEVLHDEERVSAAAADREEIHRLRQLPEPVELIDYIGPTAVHSLFLAMAKEHNMQAISLWAHAASYLQGTNYKLCSALIKRLSLLLDLDIDTTELELSWRLIEEQIESLIARNEQLKRHVEELRRSERSGSFKPKTSAPAKVISLDRFAKEKRQED